MPEHKRNPCKAVKSDGTPCKSPALVDSDYCRAHGDAQSGLPFGGLPPEERRCTATASGGFTRPERKGERCKKWAMAGQTVCDHHGGMAEQNRIAGARRVAEAKLQAQAADMVGVPVDNPLTELAGLAGRARAWMDLMQGRVEILLTATDPTAAEDGGENGIRYRGGAGEQLRAEVALYERAMDRLGKFLADYGRLGIDERLARISERQADTVIAAIEAALNAAEVRDPGLRIAAKKAAGRHLQRVA